MTVVVVLRKAKAGSPAPCKRCKVRVATTNDEWILKSSVADLEEAVQAQQSSLREALEVQRTQQQDIETLRSKLEEFQAYAVQFEGLEAQRAQLEKDKEAFEKRVAAFEASFNL